MANGSTREFKYPWMKDPLAGWSAIDRWRMGTAGGPKPPGYKSKAQRMAEDKAKKDERRAEQERRGAEGNEEAQERAAKRKEMQENRSPWMRGPGAQGSSLAGLAASAGAAGPPGVAGPAGAAGGIGAGFFPGQMEAADPQRPGGGWNALGGQENVSSLAGHQADYLARATGQVPSDRRGPGAQGSSLRTLGGLAGAMGSPGAEGFAGAMGSPGVPGPTSEPWGTEAQGPADPRTGGGFPSAGPEWGYGEGAGGDWPMTVPPQSRPGYSTPQWPSGAIYRPKGEHSYAPGMKTLPGRIDIPNLGGGLGIDVGFGPSTREFEELASPVSRHGEKGYTRPQPHPGMTGEEFRTWDQGRLETLDPEWPKEEEAPPVGRRPTGWVPPSSPVGMATPNVVPTGIAPPSFPQSNLARTASIAQPNRPRLRAGQWPTMT